MSEDQVGSLQAAAMTLRPEAVVRRLFRARAAGDVGTVLRLMAPDVEAIGVDGNRYRGQAELGRYLVRDLDSVEIHGHEFDARADDVIVAGRVRRFDGGKLSDLPACWRFTVLDGMIVRAQFARSRAALMDGADAVAA